MTVIYEKRPQTGIITTNIVYKVGSRDENMGETGLAHMLEHMLFKPTSHDLKQKLPSHAMRFESETGCILNANTWKDRTTYYFSYPKEYFKRALTIEYERMRDLEITDIEFKPEQGNVLSEYDMYNGDPQYALASNMVATAFYSHPYGHETLGWREDIEDYTSEKLNQFYKKHYRPDNATLMVVGDIELDEALKEVREIFTNIKAETTAIQRRSIREPIQEGERRIVITRPLENRVLAIGGKHAGFPTREWYATELLLDVLTEDDKGILYELLVDRGLAADVSSMVEPTKEDNLAIIFVTLTNKADPAKVERMIIETILELNIDEIAIRLPSLIAQRVTAEIMARESSLGVIRDLTEYVSADALKTHDKVEKTLKSINVLDVQNIAREVFKPNNRTIGMALRKERSIKLNTF